MKKVFFCTAFFVSGFAVKAQQNQIDETRMSFKPQIVKVKDDASSSTYEVKVKEASTGDFHRTRSHLLIEISI